MPFRQIVEAPSSFFQSLAHLIPWLSKLWRTLGQVEEWHEVGGTGEPAFENSWVNYGGVYETAAFYKDPFGVVHVKGLVASGTVGAAIFTLPAGYRPANRVLNSTISYDAIGRLDVYSTGAVIPITPSTNPWVSLDNISFRAEQ